MSKRETLSGNGKPLAQQWQQQHAFPYVLAEIHPFVYESAAVAYPRSPTDAFPVDGRSRTKESADSATNGLEPRRWEGLTWDHYPGYAVLLLLTDILGWWNTMLPSPGA